MKRYLHTDVVALDEDDRILGDDYDHRMNLMDGDTILLSTDFSYQECDYPVDASYMEVSDAQADLDSRISDRLFAAYRAVEL